MDAAPESGLCRECGQPGHIARECPEATTTAEVEAEVSGAPPWCGNCDKRTRQVEVNAGWSVARCPRCHPLRKKPLPQLFDMDAATRLRARYLRESHEGLRAASPEVQAATEGQAINAERGAGEARGQWAQRPEPAGDDLDHLHGEALAAAQLREARAAHLDLPPVEPEPVEAGPVEPEPSPNGHRAPVEGEGEFPF